VMIRSCVAYVSAPSDLAQGEAVHTDFGGQGPSRVQKCSPKATVVICAGSFRFRS
jgi:hypothetical protein